MLVWLPEKIRYDRSSGAAEIICPGCRERVVADVHEKLKGAGRVGRCRLCGFFAALPDSLALAGTDDLRFLAADSQPPRVAPFIAVAGSPHEMAHAGGVLELTKEQALLAAIAISLKWHRTSVFWSRTIFVIIAAFVLGFSLVAVAAIYELPWLAYLVMAALFLTVFFIHRRLVRLRALAEMKPRVSRFTSHFGVSVDGLVQAGLQDGGDFKLAAQFLRNHF